MGQGAEFFFCQGEWEYGGLKKQLCRRRKKRFWEEDVSEEEKRMEGKAFEKEGEKCDRGRTKGCR